MLARFEWPIRVYWEDTDAGGVVYHAAYLAFLERARTEWLRARGVDQGALREAEHLQFAVVGMTIEWRRAARYDDLLTVTAEITELGAATFGFAQTILRGAELVLNATVRVAAIHSQTLRPRRLPADIKKYLE